MMLAGTKKCRPMTFSGRFVTEEVQPEKLVGPAGDGRHLVDVERRGVRG